MSVLTGALFQQFLSRIIELSKYRNEVDRNFYNDFVSPTMARFQDVHKQFLASLDARMADYDLNGRIIVRDDPVFQLLLHQGDEWFYAEQDFKVLMSTEAEKPEVAPLANALRKYVRSPFEDVKLTFALYDEPPSDDIEPVTPVMTADTIEFIRSMKVSGMWPIVHGFIEMGKATVRSHYSQVTDAHVELKNRLLLPKSIGKKKGKKTEAK